MGNHWPFLLYIKLNNSEKSVRRGEEQVHVAANDIKNRKSTFSSLGFSISGHNTNHLGLQDF